MLKAIMLKTNLIVSIIIFGFTISNTYAYSPDSLDYWQSLIEGRIINGTQAKSGQLPWQVLLKRNSGDKVYCGGSIISADYVLTAAHCTQKLKSIDLIFGVTNINETPEIMLTSTEIFIHKNSENYYNNDVSIIKLPKSLKFSDKIKPINLLSRADAEDLFVGKPVIVSGWGLINDEEPIFSDDLLFAKLTVITNEKCKETFNATYILDSNMCAVGSPTELESICYGDSGGPLIFEKSPGNFIQIGINSFVAAEICAEGDPSVYVRLGSFLDYIHEITGITIT